MKDAKMKICRPIGLSALALMAFQAPVEAQELKDPGKIEQKADRSGAEVKTTTDIAEQGEAAVVDRDLPDSIDPIAREDLERLDRLGVVGKQAQIGEDILIIDRQIQRAEAIQKLIGYLGTDGFKLQYPKIAEELKDSPILLQADLTNAQLQAEIRKANSETKSDEATPQPREDGSDFFNQASASTKQMSPSGRPLPTRGNMNATTSGQALDPSIVALISSEVAKATEKLTKEAEKKAQEDVKSEYVPISLREVYGLNGELYAIIIHGEERIRVREGDKLPNETLVESISPDSITILRKGEETKIRIRG